MPFIRHLTLTLLAILVLASQASPPVDSSAPALLAAVDRAWTALEAAWSATWDSIKAEPWETPAETEARREADPVVSAARGAFEAAWDLLEDAELTVPANQLTLTPLAFVPASRTWPLRVVSRDPAVPFQGQVVLDLSRAPDTGLAYRAVEAALADGSLAPRLVYRVSWPGFGRFRLVALALEITWPAAAGLGHGARLPLTGYRWWVGTAWGQPQPGLIDLIYVAGGSFLMGSPEGVGDDDERPQRRVTLTGFRMGRTEVTQEQYQAVMGTNPSSFRRGADGPSRPVESVTWFEAVDFCNALSALEGLVPAYQVVGDVVTLVPGANGYRLPTEAEWEYAARGGAASRGFIYSGGNDPGPVAWYRGNSRGSTQPVATKAPNELGLYDMSGNVWEWCWDKYGAYTAAADRDPQGAASGTYRVARGGAWFLLADLLRSANRLHGLPAGRFSNFGFRVVRPL